MTRRAEIAEIDRVGGRAILRGRRDRVMLAILVTAVALLLWNGSSFVREVSFIGDTLGREARVAGTALCLNVALILFGWRQYVDLRREAELRAGGEWRAALLATTDVHTGLLNRKGFADRVGELCARAAADRRHVAILSIQVNRLKTVSDRHGYEVGDALLRAIAAALTASLDGEAEAGRVGGNEFAIALPVPGARSAVAERAAEAALLAITAAFPIDGLQLQLGAFAGIASAPAGEVEVPDLLRRGDIAMEHAKSARSVGPRWFDAGMERSLIAHSEIEQGIRQALDHDQFVPYFEPQIDLATGEIVGFEVLARWLHPLRGTISPDLFIPVAEDMGLIGRLSDKIIGDALAEAAGWDPSIKISVNISPIQLTDAWLAQRIVRLLTVAGFPPERLVVEITESSLVSDIDLARSIVTSLKNQGIQLALDDFGTGFSSLSHLRSLPFDVIKIDRSFVANIHSNPESAAIVRAVTTLASAIKVPVCVEGIATEADCTAVLELGCAVGQGWYFGKAMSSEDAALLLDQRTRHGLELPRAATAR